MWFTSGRLSGFLPASNPCSTCAHCTLACSYLLCSCSAMRRSAKRSLLQFWWGSKLSSFTVTLLLPHIKLQGEEEYLWHAFYRFTPSLPPLVTGLLPKNFVIPKCSGAGLLPLVTIHYFDQPGNSICSFKWIVNSPPVKDRMQQSTSAVQRHYLSTAHCKEQKKL